MKRFANKHLHHINIKGFSRGKIAVITSITLSIILLIFALSLLFFPKTYINGFLKSRIEDAFSVSYPKYSLKISEVKFNALKNRVECDLIFLTQKDSSFSCRINKLSIDGIGWIKLLRDKNFTPNSLTKASLDAKGIILNFNKEQNQIRFGQLHFSVPDSEIDADSAVFRPLITDKQFFSKSKFRNARYIFDFPKIRINGIEYSKLLTGDGFRVRSINISGSSIDVLVNMNKSFDKNSPSPLMPDFALASMKDTLRIDSLQLMNSRLDYRESYSIGSKAALITFDKVQLLAEGIVNHTGRRDTIVIHAKGKFMNTSNMKLLMTIPLVSPGLSFNYSGSLGQMDLTDLNKFLVIAENHLIKSGMLQSATYKINVNSGNATGFLHAAYTNLSVELLDKNTGRGNGILNQISSFIAKAFIIRGNNVPDKTGAMKIGVIKFTRKPDEPFIQFVWFALRSGVGNVVGF